MKITQDNIDYIENVVKTCQSINIDDVIIEPSMIRAIDEARTVVLFQNEDVSEMPFGSIGINRLNVFLSRLNLAKSQQNFTVDAVIEDDNEYAHLLVMKGDNLKVDYRCANPSTIQAPRQINDTLIYRLQLNAEAVNLLQKAQVAMGSEVVKIASDGEVYFELSDINNDIFKYSLMSDVELLEIDNDAIFQHKYPIKTLLSLFKQNPDGYFEIGKKGILKITVNNLDLYVLPQV